MNSIKVQEDQSTTAVIWRILETVADPEIPVLSVLDLGIIRSVDVSNSVATTKNDAHTHSNISSAPFITITITPTYTGCPAMDMIAAQIKMALLEAGYPNMLIKTTLSPAWTTDWMTESGKEKLWHSSTYWKTA
jgi:ring-1,2-phenylacetyl-CoA epoxidase subunit PaaD